MWRKREGINMDIVKEGINFKRAALNYLKWKEDYEERSCKCEENKPHKCAESKTGWINVKCKLNGGEGRAKINYRRWKEQQEQGEERLETNKPKSDEEAECSHRTRWKKLKFLKSLSFFFLKQNLRMARKEARVRHEAKTHAESLWKLNVFSV